LTQESFAWKPVFDKSFFTISESLGDTYFARRIFNVENRRYLTGQVEYVFDQQYFNGFPTTLVVGGRGDNTSFSLNRLGELYDRTKSWLDLGQPTQRWVNIQQ